MPLYISGQNSSATMVKKIMLPYDGTVLEKISTAYDIVNNTFSYDKLKA